MKFDKVKVFDCLRKTDNTAEAICFYISQYGCNGFKCKGCVLHIACTHRPVDAQKIAGRVFYEVQKKKFQEKSNERM